MITVQIEPLTERLPELMPLFPKHYAELALNQDRVPLDPDYSIYVERDRRGEVLLVTAREDAALIGYFVGFIAPGLHYRTCLTLTMDIFWVAPESRGAGAGWHIFKAVEAEARRRGVQRMLVGSKLHKDASFLFEKLGYEEVERYFTCWLGE